jgi:hypothetical protein
MGGSDFGALMGGGMPGGGLMGGRGGMMRTGGMQSGTMTGSDPGAAGRGSKDAPLVAADPDAPPPDPKVWFGQVFAGLNGQIGTANQLSFIGNARIERKTDDNLLNVTASWMLTELSQSSGSGFQGFGNFPAFANNEAFRNRGAGFGLFQNNNSITQQIGYVYAQDEFIEPGRHWNPFLFGLFEMNDSGDPRYRTGIFAGVTYGLIDEKPDLLKVRAGAGMVYQDGTTVSEWVPEALLGFTWRYGFWGRHAFVASGDLFPRLDEWGHFRVRAMAGYEIYIDPDRHLFLRLGVTEWYDTDPGSGPRNNFWYTTSLGWRF